MKSKNFVNVNVNPCKMCMPLGAVIAFRGIENSMMLLHGSQGCTAYMRNHLTTHFSEPVDIASSSLHEHATIHGGGENLKKGLRNLIEIYNPEVIGIATTCLAETIGEDVRRIVTEFREANIIPGLHLLVTNTPGYGGTLYEGYFSALTDMVKQAAKPSPGNGRINVIMGHVSPGDVRNIKGLLELFGIDHVLLPDISRTFDAPFSHEFRRIPEGGTRYGDIVGMAGARATLELGVTIPEAISPGKYLEKEYGIPLYRTPLPIGLENTDAFVRILEELSGRNATEKLLEERGRLIDGMIDMHKLNGEIEAMLYGEPDLVYSVACLCLENGIHPSVVATGSKNAGFTELLSSRTGSSRKTPLILDGTDFETLEKLALERGVNLLIGNSQGKQITEKHGIPPVRIGFPIQDRYGGQRLVYTGYNGSLKLLDDLGNAVLAKKFGMHRKIMLEKYFENEPATQNT